MQFMAIKVLQGNGHTYRRDLESFLYIFIWICIRYSHENVGDLGDTAVPPSGPSKRRVRPMKINILQDLYTGDNTKTGSHGWV
jgi:hypothetical protein